jgi:hypothetical protein
LGGLRTYSQSPGKGRSRARSRHPSRSLAGNASSKYGGAAQNLLLPVRFRGESGEQSATQAQGSIRSCCSDNMCAIRRFVEGPSAIAASGPPPGLGVGLCFCWCFAHGSLSIARGFDSPLPYRAGCRSRRPPKFIDMTVGAGINDVHLVLGVEHVPARIADRRRPACRRGQITNWPTATAKATKRRSSNPSARAHHRQ